MKIKLEIKYELGEKVYAVYKEYDGIIRVIKSEIEEIGMSKKHGLYYYIQDIVAEEFKEEELIPINRKDLLVERIDKLMEKNDEEMLDILEEKN